MLSFKDFIKEEYKTLFEGIPIYSNPSKNDIIEIFKNSAKKPAMARWLSIAPTKTIYIWDANESIHSDVFYFLKSKNIIPASVYSFKSYEEVIGGVSTIEGGSLYYDSCDELDYFAKEYEKPLVRRQGAANSLEAYWFVSTKLVKQKHALISKYINGWDKNNPLDKIENVLLNQ